MQESYNRQPALLSLILFSFSALFPLSFDCPCSSSHDTVVRNGFYRTFLLCLLLLLYNYPELSLKYE